jgi:hypothetical protein
MFHIVQYTGPFGFIKPWTAVRDELTFSQQFLTPSIIEGIRQKLEVSAILRHRLSYAGISRQQEQTQPRAWDQKIDRKSKIATMSRPRSIIKRGIMLSPVLTLAFTSQEDASKASEQHVCLCRNEDILFPVSSNTVTADEFENISGFELLFGKGPEAFVVGYNRFAASEPMYGTLIISGNPVSSESQEL